MSNNDEIAECKPTLKQAAGYLAKCLNSSIGLQRPNRRGRKSDLAGELYVRGAAEALNITMTHMSRIITGRSRPGMELASRMSKLANCTIEDILAISNARKLENHMSDSSDPSVE